MSTQVKKQHRMLKISILRYNPADPASVPHMQTFECEEADSMTLFILLNELRDKQDPSLQFDFVCRAGICGSCAMLINGKPGLACRTLTRDLPTEFTLAPLPAFELIGDLSVNTGKWMRNMSERMETWVHMKSEEIDLRKKEEPMDPQLAEDVYILDRCVERVYSKKRQYEIPTFFTLRRVLQEQDEPEAKDLALMLELFTDGTLNNFSHPTNIETENRLISFNTRGMVEDMKDLGQLVITDHMINRVSQNWENGVRTHIFLDEFHTLLQHKYSANFFDSAYRRFRKRNAWTTSLTQNVEYVLNSLTARTMLSNSEFIVMLNQSASDREQLAELLHISGEQMKYITNARAGNGLARIGSALVPFYNQMSKNSEIYKLMSTKPEDFLKSEELL